MAADLAPVTTAGTRWTGNQREQEPLLWRRIKRRPLAVLVVSNAKEDSREAQTTFPFTQVTKDDVSVNQKTKKKRQQRAQSRLALARFRKQQCEQQQQTAEQRAEKQWNKTLRQLADLGATVVQQEVQVDGPNRTIDEVTFEGKNYRFGTRFRLQRWLKRERQHQEEKQMSWAERHVQWMIENNCDDFGNPWPE